MEDIQKNEQIQQPATPVSQPDPAFPSQSVAPTNKKSNKNVVIAGIIIFVLVAITGLLLIMNKNTQNTNNAALPTQTTLIETPTPIKSNEEQEVEQVDVNDVGPTDIPSVEKDLQGL